MTTVIDTLIYDRTQEDVDRVKELKRRILNNGWNTLSAAEKTEYLAGMKGAYNASDLNRVGQAISYVAQEETSLAAELTAYRVAHDVAPDSQFDLPFDASQISVDPKTDWVVSDVPTESQVNALLSDLGEIRQSLVLPADVPPTPTSLDGMDYITANAIEYILFAIDQTLDGIDEDIKGKIDRAASAWLYSAEMNCGG